MRTLSLPEMLWNGAHIYYTSVDKYSLRELQMLFLSLQLQLSGLHNAFLEVLPGCYYFLQDLVLYIHSLKTCPTGSVSIYFLRKVMFGPLDSVFSG